jgi:hypothetical protein
VKRAALLLLFVAGAVLAQERHERGPGEHGPGRGGTRNSYADPSAVIAAEGELSRLARDKGQWTAFATLAAADAVLFRPGMVYARDWLKGQVNPPMPVQRQPQQVWSSCDGSLMVSHGAWQQGPSFGLFTTIWRRQADGSYKWVLDQNKGLNQAQNQALNQPGPQADMIDAQIADCPDRPRRPADGPPHREAKPKPEKARDLPPLDPSHRAGKSEDGTLSWDVTVDPSGTRTLTVNWRKEGADSVVFQGQTPAGLH